MIFGITPLRIDKLMAVFKKSKGLEGFANFQFVDLVEEAATIGYKHVEITADLFQLLPIPIRDEDLQKLKYIKKSYDITYSVHLPIMSLELASPNKLIREASVNSLIEAYNSFKLIESDIGVYVMHPTGGLAKEITKMQLDKNIKNFILNLFVDLAVQSVKSFTQKTAIDSTKIAIENIEFPFEGTLEIIKKLKGPNLCIDTAHFLGGFSGDVDIVDVAKQHLDITSEIHLQDYTNLGEVDHTALGKGKNFPIEFLKILHEYNFRGPIVFELSLEQARESLDFIKRSVPEIELPSIKQHY